MADTVGGFKVMIIIMLFYSFSITGLTYFIPADARDYLNPYQDFAAKVDLEDVSDQVQGTLEQQTNIPVVEVGALVFYSGNILLDLLLNFAFAIPEMISLLIQSFTLFVNVDSYIIYLIQVFNSVVITVLYFMGLIQLLTGVRSGRII